MFAAEHALTCIYNTSLLVSLERSRAKLRIVFVFRQGDVQVKSGRVCVRNQTHRIVCCASLHVLLGNNAATHRLSMSRAERKNTAKLRPGTGYMKNGRDCAQGLCNSGRHCVRWERVMRDGKWTSLLSVIYNMFRCVSNLFVVYLYFVSGAAV